LLHRAFSIFIFNSEEKLLLQKRAFGKYHSEGLWTNTCCSHPSSGETVIESGNRRLMEEMGMKCPLQPHFSFIYKAELDNGLIEHEFDHVLVGFTDQDPELNLSEASEFKWMTLNDIQNDINLHPEKYTSWFKIIMKEHSQQLFTILNHESL
jgi:isopentenyl-diphosphate delta-isomerase